MKQKRIANIERITSETNIKLEFNIPNTVFRPMPDITSSLLSITPKKNVKIKYEVLKIIVENAFKHRRKKLIHNLKHIIKKSKLEEIKDYRAEQLSIEEYQDLTYFIKK